MKTENFTRKDGTTGVSYHLEDGDEFTVVDYDKVGFNERDAMVKDTKNPEKRKRTTIPSYFLKVQNNKTGEIVTLTLTTTQGKKAIEFEPLKGKVLIGEKYTNKYGDQVALRLKK